MKKILLISIILLAAFLRLYRLTDIPPGVNRDEASIGFTAYSLLTTGKDEYGRWFPVSFESFGDWKLPLYIYTTVPFVSIFGLTELAVRLPSALAGILSVVAIYFFANALFASETIALFSAFVLAIMPWHIHISRVESEAIMATLFMILASLLFLKKRLVFSALFFAATYWTYHGNHITTSLLLLGLAVTHRKILLTMPRFWLAVGIGGLTTAVILISTFSADHTKISGISIFGDPTVLHTQIELPRLEHNNPNSLIARLIHNRATFALTSIFQNYLKSYGPDFLFIKGGGNRAHNIEAYGNLHPIEAFPLILGLAWLVARYKRRESKFILIWLAIGGIAAAITKDAPHSNRMLAVVPALAITIGAGIARAYELIPKKTFPIVTAIIFLGYSACMGIYLDRYYAHFPKTEAGSWGYAYKKLVAILKTPEYAQKRVIMTMPETSPYIYILFYSNFPPSIYQQSAKRYPISNDGFTDVSGFGRFSFRPIVWENDTQIPGLLLVARPEEVPDSYNVYRKEIISLPDKTPYWYVLSSP